MMYFDDDPDEERFDEPVPDEWDDMLQIMDGADAIPGFDAIEEPSYAVLRVVFKHKRPDWRSLGASSPGTFQSGDNRDVIRPFSYSDPARRSILLWDEPDENALDLVTWQNPRDSDHDSSHPETDAVEWLQSRQQADPYFGENILRIKLLIQDKPCKTCLAGLRSSLDKIMPAGSGADIKWVKPNPDKRYQFFRDRRYQPGIQRWNRY